MGIPCKGQKTSYIYQSEGLNRSILIALSDKDMTTSVFIFSDVVWNDRGKNYYLFKLFLTDSRDIVNYSVIKTFSTPSRSYLYLEIYLALLYMN